MHDVSESLDGAEPVAGSVVAVREPAEVELAQVLVERARADGVLTELTRRVLQAALETEMSEAA